MYSQGELPIALLATLGLKKKKKHNRIHVFTEAGLTQDESQDKILIPDQALRGGLGSGRAKAGRGLNTQLQSLGLRSRCLFLLLKAQLFRAHRGTGEVLAY